MFEAMIQDMQEGKRFLFGCLWGCAIVAGAYLMVSVSSAASGTERLIPGYTHTICMGILAVGYTVQCGYVFILRHRISKMHSSGAPSLSNSVQSPER